MNTALDHPVSRQSKSNHERDGSGPGGKVDGGAVMVNEPGGKETEEPSCEI